MKIIKRLIKDNEDIIGFDRDPEYALKSLDRFLERFGLEVVVIDNGSSDIWYKIIKKK
jgi:glycosyltransferase involved in cell wall biosynthesis